MIAVRERVLTYSGQPERWIWHTPLGPAVAEYQAIACTDSTAWRPRPGCTRLPFRSTPPTRRGAARAWRWRGVGRSARARCVTLPFWFHVLKRAGNTAKRQRCDKHIP